MKFFIDTANVDEIRDAWNSGVIIGVTTNPSLIVKEGRNIVDVISEISDIVDGPISAEVVSLTADEMVAEALTMYETIHKLGKKSYNIVTKLPMTKEGLAACKRLTAMGYKTNVTLIFSANQALLAAAAGATYVSPFVGRVDDIGGNGIALIEEIADIFTIHGINTQIIAASIRGPQDVTDSAKAGAHIATVPAKVINQMFNHPLTTAGIEKFLKDWENAVK